MAYDRALSIFSPDGKLFQVDYANEAVKKGNLVVGLRTKTIAILAVEKKSVLNLQNPRTIKKILYIDRNVACAFAGLSADARVLIDQVRVEAQSYRLTLDDAPTTEYLAKHVAQIQQKYTQSGGKRPFGISALFIGQDAEPKLYQTDPSGVCSEWKACAIGRNSGSVKEYLEKHFKDDLSDDEALLLCLRGLLEVVQSGSQNIEVVMLKEGKITHMDQEGLEAAVKTIEADKEVELATKKQNVGNQ